MCHNIEGTTEEGIICGGKAITGQANRSKIINTNGMRANRRRDHRTRDNREIIEKENRG